MKVPVRKIQQLIEQLQEIVDLAEENNVNEVTTACNTYGLSEFISFGSYGYLDLNDDAYDLVDVEEEC